MTERILPRIVISGLGYIAIILALFHEIVTTFIDLNFFPEPIALIVGTVSVVGLCFSTIYTASQSHKKTTKLQEELDNTTAKLERANQSLNNTIEGHSHILIDIELNALKSFLKVASNTVFPELDNVRLTLFRHSDAKLVPHSCSDTIVNYNGLIIAEDNPIRHKLSQSDERGFIANYNEIQSELDGTWQTYFEANNTKLLFVIPIYSDGTQACLILETASAIWWLTRRQKQYRQKVVHLSDMCRVLLGITKIDDLTIPES